MSTTPLLADPQLESSTVVANCRMNRERDLAGRNGYDRELGFHPLTFLRERAGPGRVVRWLDLCCGTGRALLQAAEQLSAAGLGDRARLVGVDLVDLFWPGPAPACLRLFAASAHTWQPAEAFDLITCVHGLHYLGDKLAVIARACSWLGADGLFVGNLDLANLRRADGRALGPPAGKMFRAAGLQYHSRRKLLACRGRRAVRFPLAYLGCSDAAGPNYTGQAAVHSFYQPASEGRGAV